MPAAIPLVAVLVGGFALAAADSGMNGTVVAAGMAAGQAVMIGDHQNDMRAAKGAGVPSFFTAWGYRTRKDEDARPSSRGHLLALLV